VFGATTVDELLTMVEEVEGSGVFDAVFVGDNLLAKPRLESVTTLSALAVKTSRVRLGTACMASFPLRDPIVLAAQWAALDNLCGGRSLLVACIGGARGASKDVTSQFQNEYQAFGIKPNERVGRLTEGMGVLRTLWTNDPASHQGRFYHFENIAVRPQPLQKPCPPIWIANSPQAFDTDEKMFRRTTDRVGRLADGWMTLSATPEQFKDSWQAICEAAEQHGRDSQSLESSLYFDLNIDEDSEKAFAETKRFLDEYYSSDFTRERIDSRSAYGPPELCAERMARYAAAGVHLMCIRMASYDQTAQLRRLIDDVVPLL
jgi:alkanesulfonate monooxygenase SsuD/methylene tetrahydromethanopterin reductase-like flavin-dependent oxidoreductase (luciferase family)